MDRLLVFAIFLIGIQGSVASLGDSSVSVNEAPQFERKLSNCACQTDQGLIDLSPIDSDDPTKPKFQAEDVRGEFRYFYNPCTSFNFGQCMGAAVCRCPIDQTNCVVIGIHAKDKFLVLEDKLAIEYSEIIASVLYKSYVSLVCGQSDDPDADFELVDPAQNNEFHFTLTSTHACPVKKGLSIGSILLIVFGCVLFVYFVCGCCCKCCLGKKEGYEMIPHHKFWLDFPDSVAEGVVFTCSSLWGCSTRCCRSIWQRCSQAEQENRPINRPEPNAPEFQRHTMDAPPPYQC